MQSRLRGGWFLSLVSFCFYMYVLNMYFSVSHFLPLQFALNPPFKCWTIGPDLLITPAFGKLTFLRTIKLLGILCVDLCFVETGCLWTLIMEQETTQHLHSSFFWPLSMFLPWHRLIVFTLKTFQGVHLACLPLWVCFIVSWGFGVRWSPADVLKVVAVVWKEEMIPLCFWLSLPVCLWLLNLYFKSTLHIKKN